jgi:hypothetical protein
MAHLIVIHVLQNEIVPSPRVRGGVAGTGPHEGPVRSPAGSNSCSAEIRGIDLLMTGLAESH